MNSISKTNIDKLYDLNNQIFDYLKLTAYDLEIKLDYNLSLGTLKTKLETFSDNHFKNSINDFNLELLKFKNEFPEVFKKLAELTDDLKTYYNKIIDDNFFEFEKVNELKIVFNKYLNKIGKL